MLQVLYKSVGLHSEMPYKSENISRQASSEEIDTTRDEGFTNKLICEFMWFSFVYFVILCVTENEYFSVVSAAL